MHVPIDPEAYTSRCFRFEYSNSELQRPRETLLNDYLRLHVPALDVPSSRRNYSNRNAVEPPSRLASRQ